MSLTQTPAPARSDLAVAPVTATAAPAAPAATAADGRPAHPYRLHGTLLTAGALSWSAAIATLGLDGESLAHQYVHNATAFLFQLGVLALLRVLWLTRAIGAGRLAPTLMRIEAGFLVLAMASTTSDFLGLTDLDNPASLMLDLFWPISMLGMFLIGIRIAVAGRWTGLSRFWPMVAESWAVVTVPTMAVLGQDTARWVGALHLVLGYAVLGRIVARKQERAEA